MLSVKSAQTVGVVFLLQSKHILSVELKWNQRFRDHSGILIYLNACSVLFYLLKVKASFKVCFSLAGQIASTEM